MGQPLTASEIATRNREVCKTRRAIALDMAAQEAFEHWGSGPQLIRSRILRLINMTQEEHDKLVVRYNLKDKYEKRQ